MQPPDAVLLVFRDPDRLRGIGRPRLEAQVLSITPKVKTG